MDSGDAAETTHDFPPFIRVYKDGRVERYMPSPYIPPGVDPHTGVESNDTVISSEIGLKARVFKPRISGPDRKLPLVVHYHGGGFCIGSAFGPTTNGFLTSLVSGSDLIAASIGYRLAPENPLPIAHEDSWAAFQWIASHSSGQGSDPWLNRYADFDRVFLLGESAGANLAHYVAVRAGAIGLGCLRPRGMVLVHPYFSGKDPDRLIQYLYPGSCGAEDDPRLNPKSDPELVNMGCDDVLLYVAENDGLRGRGLAYYETLKGSGWVGKIELVENKGEGHCFHLLNPSSENVRPLMDGMAAFVSQG